MPSPNGYVAILPPTEVDEFLKKLRAAAEGDESGQDLVATLMGASQTLWFDKAGRMALSPKLLEDAGIMPKAKSDAVLVGAGFKFHVYSEKLWKTVQARTTAARQAETMRRLAV